MHIHSCESKWYDCVHYQWSNHCSCIWSFTTSAKIVCYVVQSSNSFQHFLFWKIVFWCEVKYLFLKRSKYLFDQNILWEHFFGCSKFQGCMCWRLVCSLSTDSLSMKKKIAHTNHCQDKQGLGYSITLENVIKSNTHFLKHQSHVLISNLNRSLAGRRLSTGLRFSFDIGSEVYQLLYVVYF